MTWQTSGVRSSDHPLDLLAASRDLWPGGTLDLWQGRSAPIPDRVYWPEDEAQVLAVLRSASRLGVPVVPYGAGSGVCGGARGRQGSVVLDLKALDHIGPLDPERRTVDVGAGVNGQHLEDWLEERGFTLGHSPSSISCSTVGGWAAARGAGQFSSRYGVFEDMVLSLTAVAPGPGAFTVGEGGDAPPAWLPMLLGSEGTLAAITRARLRVWPAPRARWLRGYQFADLDAAVGAMRELMQAELWPAVLRLYDPVDTRIGGRTRPKKAERDDGDRHRFVRDWFAQLRSLPEVKRRSLALPLALPGVVNRIFDHLASGCLLVVGWEGEPDVVDACVAAGRGILDVHGEDLGAEPGERWYASRHAVSYKLMPIFERGGFADTMEVACRWSQLVPLYDAVRAALSRTAVVMAHMSHAYPEGGSIYFSFAGRGDADVYARTWQAALAACLEVGATVTHHHGVGSLKAEAASAEAGPAVHGWGALKEELDPAGVMNPGRLFVPVEPRDPGAPSAIEGSDGVVRVAADASVRERVDAASRQGRELAWPWAALPGRPRWQRCPWQSTWFEARGTARGARCLLGRGPRSAAGPDLRGWLVAEAPDASVTIATAPVGPRWLGRGSPERPWAAALAVLHADLRPAVLTVRDGALLVGFRGPACAALGAVAASVVPGGLEAIGWEQPVLPTGNLERCAIDDPAAVTVDLSGALREVR